VHRNSITIQSVLNVAARLVFRPRRYDYISPTPFSLPLAAFYSWAKKGETKLLYTSCQGRNWIVQCSESFGICFQQ